MNLLTVKEAAEKWGVTPRRVQGLCSEGSIKGAVRFGRAWMIPAHAVLPSSAKGEEPHMPMPRRSPFLDMTNLYNKAGGADECAEMLINNPEAHKLFEANIAYRRGEIARVYKHARYFLNAHSGLYAILGAGMLLSNCAIWSGDEDIWYEAKRHICEAPHETEQEREIISLTLAVIDSSIYNNGDFPDWFISGNFEALPPDSHPVACVFYVKYLYMTAFALASGQQSREDMRGLSMMRMIPNIVEPLITKAVVEKTVLTEILLRLSCAVAYHNSGRREKATAHIDKAVNLALQDGFYGTLAEYTRHFDGMLEERIALVSESALERVKELSAVYTKSWSKLSGKVRNKLIAQDLTPREREIAKLAAFGFTNKEIAQLKFISESTVKQAVLRIVQKTGVKDRTEIATIL